MEYFPRNKQSNKKSGMQNPSSPCGDVNMGNYHQTHLILGLQNKFIRHVLKQLYGYIVSELYHLECTVEAWLNLWFYLCN